MKSKKHFVREVATKDRYFTESELDLTRAAIHRNKNDSFFVTPNPNT